jgi:hypothetical protein
MATNTSKNPTPEKTPDFMSTIQDKLLEQSSLVSSTNSNLESRLNTAISGVETSAEKSNKALESAYGRERAFQEGQGSLKIQDQLEGRTGFATQMIALRNLVETTDKSLKDLEQRKNELILQNDANAAAKVSELQFKALEFQQQAQQQTFSNLLGMANFGISSAQEQRLTKAQTFTENKAMSDIALQYGIDLKPGDTIDTITSKAMVFASEEQKARLAKLQSEIKYNNAQTAKILNGDGANKVNITPEITTKLAARWNELAAKGFTVDTSAEMENILGKYAKAGKEADFYDAVSASAAESAKAQFEAAQAKESPQDTRGKSFTEKGLPGALSKFGAFGLNSASAFSEFLLGQDKGTFPRY